MARIEGGCLCGAVRYRTEAEPVMQVVCHCKTCQKNTGSAFSTNAAVPEAGFTVEGDALHCYEDHSGASGQPFYRHYCGSCGSHLFSRGPATGPVVFIKAGTLDDASWLAPSLHIWCAEKLPWVTIPEGATQIAGNPG